MSDATAPTDNRQLITDLHVEATYRLTEALIESENRMRRRLELLSEVVFETDRTGALIYLNDAWTRVSGFPVSTSLGRPLLSFIEADDQAACQTALDGDYRAVDVIRQAFRLRRRDDRTAWVELSSVLLPSGGAVGALHDVTREHEAAAELAKLSQVALDTDNLVIITDASGVTEWVNRAFIERTGYTLAEMQGRRPGAILQGPDTDPATVARIREAITRGVSISEELLNYTRDGAPYWIRVQISPVRDANGVVQRFVSVQTDTTALRQIQRALEDARDRAEASSVAKSQFLAMISHEMRTPLNAILGSADLAMDEVDAPDSVRPYLQQVSTSAETLLRLITDMLDVSKMEAGHFDIERIPVALSTCISRAAAPLATRARAKGLQWICVIDDALPAYVNTDPDRLQQIISNLVDNAIKFTDTGRIKLEARLGPSDDDGPPLLDLAVVDSGIGIAPDAQARIFDRFEQVDTTISRRKGGAGLGLNIVRALVETMGGRIAVTSMPGLGSEFRVVLPLEPTEASAVPAPAPASAPEVVAAQNHHILVAEDTDANFVIIEAYLTRAGYTVARALNGYDARTAAQSADLVLMDIEMPGMDGLEATRLIREDEASRGDQPVPIIALTAHAIQGYRERCLRAGCSGYLTKPIRKPALLDAVHQWLTFAPGRTRRETPARILVEVDADLFHIVPVYDEQCREDLAGAQVASETGALDELARIAHRLKGSSLSLGFLEAGEIARQLEAASKAGDAQASAASLGALRAHLARVQAVPKAS